MSTLEKKDFSLSVVGGTIKVKYFGGADYAQIGFTHCTDMYDTWNDGFDIFLEAGYSLEDLHYIAYNGRAGNLCPRSSDAYGNYRFS